VETAVENPLRFWPEPVWAPGPFEKVELRDFDLTETENPMTEDRLAQSFPRSAADLIFCGRLPRACCN
jgi:hypothetical protein